MAENGNTKRVQFDIPEELYQRALPFIKAKKNIGVFGMIAFEEWVKRREGRDGRSLTQNKKLIKELVQECLEELK
jgi:hypothetical protein